MNPSQLQNNCAFISGCYLWEEKREPEAAAELFQQAVREGCVEACYALGVMYLEGVHFCFDEKKAEKYLLMAAEKGFAPAQRDLGYIYWNGLFDTMELNHAKAEKWFSEALKKQEPGTMALCHYYGILGYQKSPWQVLKILHDYSPVNFVDSLQMNTIYYTIVSELGYYEESDRAREAHSTCDIYGFCSAMIYMHDRGGEIFYKAVIQKNPQALYLYAGSVYRTEDAVMLYMEAARLGHRKAIDKINNFWKCVALKAKEFTPPEVRLHPPQRRYY